MFSNCDATRSALIRFRSALADVTSSFSNDSFTQAFKDEVQEAWVKTVEPALLEIRELIRDNRYLRALWEQVVMPPTGLASLAGLVVGVTKLHGIPEFLAVGTAAALPSVRAAWTHTAAQRQAERNQFYFLYRAEQALAYKSAT